ncbi:MAG: hypothetical protein KGP28_08790 [Bdellovibrionales bacterium]|nr:hypothetical protein [Bdellovibrionales bacterium]
MKNLILFLTVLILSNQAALAAPRSVASADHTKGSPASGSPEHDFGLGFASFGAGVLASTAISAWIPINHNMGVQTYLSIPTTSGNFNFYAGGAYKYTISGTAHSGFHIGGDILLGATAGEFTLLGGGLIGLHFSPAQSVVFSVDGGPQVSLVASKADFLLSGLSGILGASLIYFF